jgi:hypothetical protein
MTKEAGGHKPWKRPIKEVVVVLQCLQDIDLFGRKTICILGFTAGAALLYACARTGAQIPPSFALLFASTFFCLGLLGLITGPIATEAAPTGLMSSRAGVIIGTMKSLAEVSRPPSPGVGCDRYPDILQEHS